MSTVATWLAGVAGVLVSVWTIGLYLRKFGRWVSKIGRALGELAKLPDAVQQLSDSLRELGTNHTARLDEHERELARLATFHPRPEVLTL